MRIRFIIIGLLIVSAAYAQTGTPKPKSSLQSEINSQFPDNLTGAITPQILRNVFSDSLASWQQYTGINAQIGTTYTVQASDYGQLVTFNNSSAIAVTLPQANGSFSSFNFHVANLSSGNVTVTPQGGSTINGAANIVLPQNGHVWIVSDGNNYQIWGTPTFLPCTLFPQLPTSGDVTTTAGSCVASFVRTWLNQTITSTLVNTASPSLSASNTSAGLLLRSAKTITSVNLTLPLSPIDGEQYWLATNQGITTINVSAAAGGNMATNSNVTTVTSSNTFGPATFPRFIWYFNSSDSSWYRMQ